MTTGSTLLLVLDLAGVFAFALNGALTAVRVTRIDIVGVVTLGMTTALGGGIIRDIIIDDLPPATFSDWRYLAVAAVGSLLAFFGSKLEPLSKPITVFDALGLSLFAVTGAAKALDFGLGPMQAVILGTITGVGGGTVRDVLIGRVPVVLSSELYAIPAMVAATVIVVCMSLDVPKLPAALGAATLCFVIRMIGVRYGLNAPGPRGFDGPDPPEKRASS
ncbi:trimeric intracellular cation channel family protein [Rhodococcus chondri]|uniref:TRIC cation channel family protein n=1 Tax=Rhodococcus chondri TaxID=3065941 RepID=A0ABU7JM92_9NOCA|nr:TRIC cation channel family protein [Rhodococcus sp. CC-R104]MEE2031166.1 TRIC cation channel family protein [Rhodococcus sp. CC-R104]